MSASSPATNVVVDQAFAAGKTLLEIADLDPIRLRLSLSEPHLAHVQLQHRVWVEFPQLGNRTYDGCITFISPQIDPQTRRGKARVGLHNPRHELCPGMWGTAEIQVELGKHLALPASAVLDTGTRTIEFVLRADNHLEAREVTIGYRTDEWRGVRSGLAPGENVVTRALFFVNADSQLKAAIAGMDAAGERPK